MLIHIKLFTGIFIKSLLLGLSFTIAVPVMAHGSGGLEEIIVTAQRREQSLQEVPISISTISSAEIMKQGFREMEDIESFSPSVNIEANLHDTSITIRGMGNDVANMSIEQSAPIFVDGITYGRGSMINIAFLDLERIEVLKGPQPVYFGQNAVAGAFSVTTKKPTPEWEADITAEVGNFSRVSFEGGVGGPITDTWGIRLAGQYDKTECHLLDMFSGEPFPYRRDFVGRVMLQWRPTDKFQALFKVDYMDRNSEGDPSLRCSTPGLLNYDETAVIQRGLVPAWDVTHARDQGLTHRLRPCANNGFESRIGFKEGQAVRPRGVEGYNNRHGRGGTFDIGNILADFKTDVVGIDPGLEAREPMHASAFMINMTYEFDNGIQLESNSGMIDYKRSSYEDNQTDPFIVDDSNRTEKFDMWSQEIRVRSPSGGQIEWDVGAYYQRDALDLDPAIVIRPHLRTPVRWFHPWGDSEWKSVFGVFTFNFLDDQASLDLGARFTDVHKFAGARADSATYIFNIDPVNPATGTITTTQHRHPEEGGNVVRTLAFATGPGRNDGGPIIDCGQPHFRPQILIGGGGDPSFPGDIITASGSPCGSYGAGFYTSRYNNRDTPDMWDGQQPVAFSPILTNFSHQPGPFLDTIDDSSFDPQVTLRYRPTDNISVYGKWAQAFKAGGFDTSDRAMPNGGIGTSIGQEEWSFGPEKAEIYELGARGSFYDNRVRWGITGFYQEIVGLQVETSTIDLEQARLGLETTNRGQTNQGTQITKGIDFDATWLVSDGLILQLAGVYQKGEMQDFIAGCTDPEFINALTNGCYNDEESAAELGLNIGDPGYDALSGFIDRAGQQAPRTPEWKVILGLDYERPMFDRYKYSFNSKLGLSAGYTEDTLGYSYTVSWDSPVPKWNMNVGFGSADDAWNVNVWLRNILGTIQQYHPEEDLDPNGIVGLNAGPSNFFTYGVQLSYQFR